METTLSLYECQDLITAIEARAEANGGEISEQDLQTLVVAQTTSIEKLGRLCGFMRFVEGTIDLCKQEEQRLAARRKAAENKLESIRKFLTPFVAQYRAEKGHALQVGTFSLSTRKTSSVEISEDSFFTDKNRNDWCRHKESWEPDKTKIKVALQGGTEITGAGIVERESLSIR